MLYTHTIFKVTLLLVLHSTAYFVTYELYFYNLNDTELTYKTENMKTHLENSIVGRPGNKVIPLLDGLLTLPMVLFDLK